MRNLLAYRSLHFDGQWWRCWWWMVVRAAEVTELLPSRIRIDNLSNTTFGVLADEVVALHKHMLSTANSARSTLCLECKRFM